MKRGDVWVWLPRERERTIAPVAAELLSEGGALARRLSGKLTVLCDLPPEADERRWLGAWGVERVRSLGFGLPPHPPASGGRTVLAPLLNGAEGSPAAVLLAADTFGGVTAPLLAEELNAALVPGVTGLTTDGSRIVLARPALEGRFESLVSVPAHRGVVATLLPRSVGDHPRPPVLSGRPRSPKLERASLPAGAAGPEGAPALIPPDPATLDLSDAERIVAFGRGAFSPEAIALVRRLAGVLGAVVAGTRPAADEGWLPFSRQIGLTGAIVRPHLYVAVGLSGAPYHMTGVKEPGTLIAVNTDPEAPIFQYADLGLVGNLFQVLPALIQQLEERPPGDSTFPASSAVPSAPGSDLS